MPLGIKIAIAAIVGIVVLPLMLSMVYTVESGHRAIVFTNGEISEVVTEGLHFKVPVFQSIIKVDVKTQVGSSPAAAGSKDMQAVHTKVSINYHLASDRLDSLYAKIGLDVESKVIDPRIQEAVKAVIAKYSADQLLAQRESVKKEISALLTTMLTPYYVVVEDIQITDFDFSDVYKQAIEAKQTAEQRALQAKNDLERIKIEAEQRITGAKAEAEAIRIQAAAIQSQGGKDYVQLKWIERWNGIMPTHVLGDKATVLVQ